VPVVGVVNASGVQICAAVASCTASELAGLLFKSAEAAKAAGEAALFATAKLNEYNALALQKVPALANDPVYVKALADAKTAETKSLEAQAAANAAIADYKQALALLGVTGTTIAPSTGTTGTTGTTGSTGTT